MEKGKEKQQERPNWELSWTTNWRLEKKRTVEILEVTVQLFEKTEMKNSKFNKSEKSYNTFHPIYKI